MKSINSFLIVGFLILLFQFTTNAQTYQMSIANITKTSNTIEFDVYIKSTGTSFTLTSYQGSINFNNQLVGTGTLSFSYIANSSEIANYPRYGIGVNSVDGKREMTFASAATPSVTITSTQKRIGRFRLQNSISFADYPLNLSWCFTGKSFTLVTTTAFKNITNSASHIVITTSPQIILAAEKAYLGNGALTRTKTGSLGTRVVYFPKNSSYIRFTINIPKAGNWYAWGRFFYENSSKSANAVNLKLDGGSAIPMGNNNDQFNRWHWDGEGVKTSGTLENLPLGYLSAGTHTIVISGREVGYTVMIDQLLLTQDNAFRPTDSNIDLNKPTDVSDEEVIAQTPKEFELMQNFPNPFNPSTTIRFSLSNTSEVNLVVYDILGNEVQTLVDDIKDAGYHEVTFDASHLSSGVYLYVLKAGNFTATKKLMLMK